MVIIHQMFTLTLLKKSLINLAEFYDNILSQFGYQQKVRNCFIFEKLNFIFLTQEIAHQFAPATVFLKHILSQLLIKLHFSSSVGVVECFNVLK